MLRLNVGCGKRNFGPGWYHIDADASHAHVQWTDVYNLPFDAGAVDMIYTSHMLSYFDWQEALELVRRWREKLKLGGTLRVAVPDFAQLAALYSEQQDLPNIIGPLFGRWPRGGGGMIYHRCTYDERQLRLLLRNGGYHAIARWCWPPEDAARYDDYAAAVKDGKPISLNLEGVKVA